MQLLHACRLGTGLLIALGLQCATAQPDAPSATPKPAAQPFDLQAHRGGRGLLPENTLVAFEAAIRLGVSTLESDIAITADGIPVLSHNPALNPDITRDGSGQWLKTTGPLIRHLTLAQLQGYDVGRINPATPYAASFAQQQAHDGQRIPTLASLFQRVNELGAQHIEFDLETKINPHEPDATLAPEPFVQTLLGVIREHGMAARVMVQSFDWRTLELLHRLAPGLRTVYLTAEFENFHTLRDGAWTAGRRLQDHELSIPKMVRASAGPASGVTWSPAHNHLAAPQVQQAHALGLRVIPWAVNDKAVMGRLIDWGVDGLITDYPDRLREVMAARGMALPPGIGR